MMAWNTPAMTSSETPQASACCRARVSTRSSTSRTTTGMSDAALTRPTSAARSMRRRSSSSRARSTSAIESRRLERGSAGSGELTTAILVILLTQGEGGGKGSRAGEPGFPHYAAR